MSTVNSIGLRLLSLPALSQEDIDVLERFENKILNDRTVFLSYSRKDVRIAELIETGLERHNVHVSRDSNLLRIGMGFEAALAHEVRSCDAFMVLQHFPVNLNQKDSQSVSDERVCRH